MGAIAPHPQCDQCRMPAARCLTAQSEGNMRCCDQCCCPTRLAALLAPPSNGDHP